MVLMKYIPLLLTMKLLVVPEFPQARCLVCLDPARCLQRVEVAGAEILSMDVQPADVECAAIQTKCATGVELHHDLCQAVIDKPFLHSPGQIAKNLVRFLDREGDPEAAERRAQPPHISEQGRASVNPVDEAENAWLRQRLIVVASRLDDDWRRRGAGRSQPSQADRDGDRKASRPVNC